MATIRLPRIRHVRAFIAAVAGTAAISTLSTVAPAGADEAPVQTPDNVKTQESDHATIERAIANADLLQGVVETARAELDRAESDAAAAEERIAQINAELAQVSEGHDTSNERVVALETELQQAHEEKQAAESRVAKERRNLAQNEARLHATQRFAEATFARQQESASQNASGNNVELSEQDTLDTDLNQAQRLDNESPENNFRVNPETLTKNDKPEGFTDEVIGEGSQPAPSMPNGAEDPVTSEAPEQDQTAPEADFGNALNKGVTPTFQTVDFGTGSSVDDALGIANDIAAAVDEDDVRTLMQGSSDLLGLGSPSTAPAASADAPETDELSESDESTTGADAGRDAQIEAVISRAESQVGVPYVWGGGDNNGPTGGLRDGGVADSFGDFSQSGFDCSGLVKYAYAAAGLDLPHYTGAQYQQGKKVSRDNAQRGDLIFYGPGGNQHVAIYLGDGQMIEAPQSGQTVSVVPVRWGGATPDVVRLL